MSQVSQVSVSVAPSGKMPDTTASEEEMDEYEASVEQSRQESKQLARDLAWSIARDREIDRMCGIKSSQRCEVYANDDLVGFVSVEGMFEELDN